MNTLEQHARTNKLGRVVLILCLLSGLVVSTSLSQGTHKVALDEFGNFYFDGFLQGSVGQPPGGVAQDPISHQTTLSYNFLSWGVNPGDIVLTNSNGSISDILRFTQTGFGHLFWFSEADGTVGSLADGAFPTNLQSNVIFLGETSPQIGVAGLFGYNALGGQPGGGNVGGFGITYDFYSDGLAPEPSTPVLLALGGLLALRKRR